jgi:hypothetical protein
MKAPLHKVDPPALVSDIKLTHARVRLALNHKIVLGKASAQFIGHRLGSIKFSFVPKGRQALGGIEALEFELTRNQAWFLAEWISNQSIRRAPKSAQKAGPK